MPATWMADQVGVCADAPDPISAQDTEEESRRSAGTWTRAAVEGGGPGGFDAELVRRHRQMLAEYIDWRADDPTDDLICTIAVENGQRRGLTRTELLGCWVDDRRGRDATAARLIGFTAQLLADRPGPAPGPGQRPGSLIHAAMRRCCARGAVAIQRGCRCARCRAPRSDRSEGLDHVASEWIGEPRRAPLRPRPLDLHRKDEGHIELRLRPSFLSWRRARATRRRAWRSMRCSSSSPWDVDYQRAYKAHATTYG